MPAVRAPRVGERFVYAGMFDKLGRRGKRMEGFSDPGKRMSWVQYDDGEYRGEFTKDLVAEKEYPKTYLYELLEKGEYGKGKRY